MPALQGERPAARQLLSSARVHERSDVGLVLGAASIAGALAVVHPLTTLLVVGCALLLSRLPGARPLATAWLGLALLVAAGSAGRVHRALARDAAAWSQVRAHLPHASRCFVVGRVASMPTYRGTLSADLRLESIACDGANAEPLAGLRLRLYELPDAAVRGDRVEAVAQLAPSRRVQQPELPDPRPQWARRGHVLSGSAVVARVIEPGPGLLSLLDRARHRLRAGLGRTLPPSAAPIARAMVLGEEDLAPDDDEAFRRSGLTHLLAVSGSHVALVVGGLVWLLQRALERAPWLARRWPPARLAAALGVPLAAIYEQVAGDSGSARRATAMAVVILVVRASARTPHIERTIGASVLAAVILDPLAPFDLSFTLSIAATVGLVALGPPIDRALGRLRPTMLRRAATATLAASVACAPLVAGISASLPLLGVVANLVAVPIGELAALPLCNLAALVGAVSAEWPQAPAWPTRLVGHAAAGSIVFLRGVARVAAAPSGSTLGVPPPTAEQLAVLCAAVVGAYVHRRARASLAALGLAAVLLLELVHVRASRPRGVLRITSLDVGQGDATLIDLPAGGAMLIDAGGEVGSSWDPGRAVVAPVLAMRRRRTLDAVVLSHPHPDHFLGLPSALAATDVGAFWHDGLIEPRGPLGPLLGVLQRRRVPLVGPEALCGRPWLLGGATVEVLHPCPAPDRDRGANDNSLVLRIGYGARHALLVGDAEAEAEQVLLADPRRLSADYLKVGHHGSRTSSGERFLDAVRPTFATISCGARNRFGHPHERALEALLARDIRVFRTDLEGSVRFETDGEKVSVATAAAGW